MNKRKAIAGLVLALVGMASVCATQLWPSPDASYTASRVAASSEETATETPLQTYRLPAADSAHSPLESAAIDQFKMVQRMKAWNLDGASLVDPSPVCDKVLERVEADLRSMQRPAAQVAFSGGTAAELQAFIDEHPGVLVRVEGERLLIDQTIILRDNTFIDAHGCAIECTLEGSAFVADGVNRVLLSGLDVQGGAYFGVYVVGGSHIVIEDCRITRMADAGIALVQGTTSFAVRGCTLQGNGRGALLVAGGSSLGLVDNNAVSDNLGCSYWMSGIVLSDLALDDPYQLWAGFEGDPPLAPAPVPLAEVRQAPHDIVVRNNTLEGNQAAGLFVDGAFRCFATGNVLAGNDREGVRLGFGATGIWLAGNTVRGNGFCALQDDDALALSGMLDAGRNDDGSAVAKLGGIALDNVAYSVVQENTVEGNAGGGILAESSTLRCHIVGNVVSGNSVAGTPGCAGISLGNAEGDSGAVDRDYLPAYENMVLSNRIDGHHASGIVLERGAAGNVLVNNVVEGADAPLDSRTTLQNSFSGNRL